MSFSKTGSLPALDPSSRFGMFGADESEAPQGDATTSRHAAIRDLMRGWLEVATAIAGAVRANEVIALQGFDGELLVDTSPIDIRELEALFAVPNEGRPRHATFGYAVAAAPARVAASAQPHLYQLTTRIMELNVFCQRAQLSETLRVALQSPKLPPLIDRILVGAAFFAAYFENLDGLPNGPIARTRLMADVHEMERMRSVLDQRLLMAADHMFAPQDLNTLLPYKEWPFIGIETLTPAHPGERFANKVYFPADMVPPKVLSVLRAIGPIPA